MYPVCSTHTHTFFWLFFLFPYGTKVTYACAASGLTQQTITDLRAVTVYQVNKLKTKTDLYNDYSGTLGAVTVYQVKNPLFKEHLNMCITNKLRVSRVTSVHSTKQERGKGRRGEKERERPQSKSLIA